MDQMLNRNRLSIIIPTLNEGDRLPAILADLQLFPSPLEIIIVDGSSNDKSIEIASLAGAKVIKSPRANRGDQLHLGASLSTRGWILFLHSDSRLEKDWHKKIQKIISKINNINIAWYFDFKLRNKGIILFFLEKLVFLRNLIYNTPYGDQGLLISKQLYYKIGGYSSLALMEDVDIIDRLKMHGKLQRILLPIYTSSRRWRKSNIIYKAYLNARLRHRWRNGESALSLSKEYYNDY